MDQLKPALEFLKQYGFWIGVSVILLGALGVWYTVTSELVAESDSRAQKIRGEISTVGRIRGELSDHPNPVTHEKMEEIIEAREAEVLKAWQTVFDAQRDILVWPEKELTKELIDEYRDLIPIEQYVAFPPLPEQDVETELRNQYRYYIDKVLPGIAKIAKAEWTASFDSASASGGGMEMGMDTGMDVGMGMASNPTTRKIDITGSRSGPLVKWPSGAQQSLITELFPWKGRRPSTLDVYYSQENLWILRQLLAIIADVNGDARQPFEAKIRQINRLSMGRKVRFVAGSLSSPGVQSMGGAGGMDMGMGMDMGEGMDMGMDMGMGMGMDMGGGMDGGMGGVEIDPADGRYVDTQFQPITGSQLRSALESESPTDAPLKVAKRVPVMMSLQIDQRSIPELLAACGSAPLMVQVKQTRILPLSGAATASSGMDTGMDTGMETGMGMDMGMDMGMGSSATPTGGDDQFPLDVTVEVYGLIHIYNPPRKDKLGVDQITAETIIDGETMAQKVEAEKAANDIASPDASLPAPPVSTTNPATDGLPAAAPEPAVSAPAVAEPAVPAAPSPVPDGPAAVPAPAPAAVPVPGLPEGAFWSIGPKQFLAA